MTRLAEALTLGEAKVREGMARCGIETPKWIGRAGQKAFATTDRAS